MKLRLIPEQEQTLNSLWNFGGNTCHTALWFRSDMQNHLKLAHQELGFQYVRSHGILNDDMDVVREDGSFHFDKIGDAIQILLDIGLKPFVELSSMPGVFASDDKSITAYVFRSAPPKNWDCWYRLIKELILYLEQRFSKAELLTWYFEVWNEPDISFWTGTQDEYFKLYDLAAQAIKEADPHYKVGGPATARTNWIDEFLDHITGPQFDYKLDIPSCDFIATHAYPSDLEFLDSDYGEVEIKNSNIMQELFSVARDKIDQALGKEFPLIIGEWNSSAGPLAFNHDECNNAAFITKTLVELMPFCQGSLVWNISDIYEECNFHYQPFHGGYGQITVNDIPKASFHAFKMLNRHQGQQIGTEFDQKIDGVGALATESNSNLCVTLYFNREPGIQQPESLQIDISGFQGEVKVTSVLPESGSAYETWRKLDSPDYLNQHIFTELLEASEPKIEFMPANDRVTLNKGTIVQLEGKIAGG